MSNMYRISVLAILFGFVFGRMNGEDGYEIKAYEGTFFSCEFRGGITDPYICSGIILEADTTQLDISNEWTFFRSLFKNAKFGRNDDEMYFFRAFNIVFPPKNDTDLRENYDLAQKLRLDFFDLCAQNEKEIRFKTRNGRSICISYCKVKGLFLSIPHDSYLKREFPHPFDVPRRLLPGVDSWNVLLSLFECAPSQHIFLLTESH